MLKVFSDRQKRHDLSKRCSTLKSSSLCGETHVLDCNSWIGAVVDDDPAGDSVSYSKPFDVSGQAAAICDPGRFDRYCVVQISQQSLIRFDRS